MPVTVAVTRCVPAVVAGTTKETLKAPAGSAWNGVERLVPAMVTVPLELAPKRVPIARRVDPDIPRYGESMRIG